MEQISPTGRRVAPHTAHRTARHTRLACTLAVLGALTAGALAQPVQAERGPRGGDRGGERGGDHPRGGEERRPDAGNRVAPAERPGAFRHGDGRPQGFPVPVPVPVPAPVGPPRMAPAPPAVIVTPPPRVVVSPPPYYHQQPPVYRPHPWLWWGGPRPYAHYGGYPAVRLAPGVIVTALPPFATVVTVGSARYWHADGVYYRERPYGYGGWEVVPPPAELDAEYNADRMYVYPRSNQSPEQQASDEYECHRWAVDQSGFDPTAVATGETDRITLARKNDYKRALTACLDGRGYTVK